jgi:hypothetical protein
MSNEEEKMDGYEIPATDFVGTDEKQLEENLFTSKTINEVLVEEWNGAIFERLKGDFTPIAGK